MCGECYFQMGVLDQALLHYTNALQLYQQFPDWMTKVQFAADDSPRPRPARRKAVPWGASTRQSRLGHYPRQREDSAGDDRRQPDDRSAARWCSKVCYYPITPQEIVRCTTLALRRRAAIARAGRASSIRSSNDVIAALSRSVGQPNHWSSA